MPVVKNQRGFYGDFFELFSRKSVKFVFYRNRCAESITTAVWPPPSPGHERADGRTSAGRSALIFERILVYPLDKTKFLRFLVHSSMIITFRVIPNIVRKLLILTRF
jgi:hypothetical protein